MGYLFLTIALFAGATKGYCGKKTSGHTPQISQAILANLVRMLFCAAIGVVWVLVMEGPQALIPSGQMLLIALLSGVATAVFVVTWLISVKKSAYMLLDVFLTLGTLIPLSASSLFFEESVKLTQWGGMGVLLLAVLIMCSYNSTVKTKITLPALLLLVLCGIANGVADFSQKLFAKQLPNGPVAAFNLYTYISSAAVLAITYVCIRKKDVAADKMQLGKIIGYIGIMAVCLYAHSYFKTLAAGHLSAVLLYPLNQGSAMVLSALMASVFFKEKLTAKAVIGMVTAFAGLLIINWL